MLTEDRLSGGSDSLGTSVLTVFTDVCIDISAGRRLCSRTLNVQGGEEGNANGKKMQLLNSGFALCKFWEIPKDSEMLQGDFSFSYVNRAGSNLDHGSLSIKINVPSDSGRNLNLGCFSQGILNLFLLFPPEQPKRLLWPVVHARTHTPTPAVSLFARGFLNRVQSLQGARGFLVPLVCKVRPCLQVSASSYTCFHVGKMQTGGAGCRHQDDPQKLTAGQVLKYRTRVSLKKPAFVWNDGSLDK